MRSGTESGETKVKLKDKVFLLTIEEWIVFLSGCNAEGLLMPQEVTGCTPAKPQITKAVLALIQKGLLTGAEDHYQYTEEAKLMLGIVEYAEATLLVLGQGMRIPAIFAYQYEDAAVQIQSDPLQPGQLRVRAGLLKELVREYTEFEFMPEKLLPAGEVDQKLLKPQDIPPLAEDAESVLDREEVLLLIDRYRRGNYEAEQRVMVIRDLMDDAIVTETKEQVGEFPYSADEFCRVVMNG